MGTFEYIKKGLKVVKKRLSSDETEIPKKVKEIYRIMKGVVHTYSKNPDLPKASDLLVVMGSEEELSGFKERFVMDKGNKVLNMYEGMERLIDSGKITGLLRYLVEKGGAIYLNEKGYLMGGILKGTEDNVPEELNNMVNYCLKHDIPVVVSTPSDTIIRYEGENFKSSGSSI